MSASLVIATCGGFGLPGSSGQLVEIEAATSVLSPVGQWQVDRKKVLLGESVQFSKEHEPFASAEDVHTIIASLETHGALGLPDHEQVFRHFGAGQEEGTEGGRLTSITYSASRDSSGPDCLRYTSRIADRGVPQYPGRVFLLYERGKLCFHPTRPILVWAAWSERFLEGRESSATVSEEVERFLGSVLFLGGPQPTATTAIPWLCERNRRGAAVRNGGGGEPGSSISSRGAPRRAEPEQRQGERLK